MNDLLARAGSLFLAPAAPVAPAAMVAPPVADLAGVLAAPADLACVAGGVAAALRRRPGARAAIVCAPGPPPAGRPASPAATALARRLSGRELNAVAGGTLCRVALPENAEAGVREAWRVVAAAAGAPVVIALARRCDGFDALLAQVDRLLLGTRPADDCAYTGLALEALAALGPPAALVTVPAGLLARRAAALGLAALELDAGAQEAPA